MLTFGFVTLNFKSEDSYFTEVAKHAWNYKIDCFRFVPSKIHPLTLKVNGERYNHTKNMWEESEFDIPHILYDRCFYSEDDHSKKCKPIVSWLKKRPDLVFIGYGLPNKLKQYETLRKYQEIKPYIPPAEPILHAENVIDYLEKQKKIIIKPINGSSGHGLYLLEKYDDGIVVKTEKQQLVSRFSLNKEKMMILLNKLLKQRQYLVQPYFKLSDELLRPFDIRVLLQKDKNGQWTERGRGVRVGKENGLLSNLSAGAKVISFETWIKNKNPLFKHFICTEINEILSKLPIILEKEFPQLFELGMDIGVAKDGAIWILDINSKPGRKVALQTNPLIKETLYSAPLVHGLNVMTRIKKEREEIIE
ncbi:YheC/YheD family endospore coat-associated protein [Bacillus aquiflavi]|uniref:YheC/YheD family endospore coat-associated protein n=1 Tax=Bacillus aquiflavi TaxID=2672567 RepID=UPI001FE72694|nr:YheC/YheD family protein [Bacillus aquiflavi]